MKQSSTNPAESGAASPPTHDLPPKRSLWRRALKNTPLLVGGSLFLLILALALVTPALLQVDVYAVKPADRLAGPSAAHLLGTDTFGRDLLARIAAGAETSLLVGGCVALLSALIGTVIGLLASTSAVLDQFLMRACDGLMAIPALLLAVALAAALGPTLPNLVFALTVVSAPSVARLVRSRALAVTAEAFVEASRAQGAGPLHVTVRHVLPNILSVLAVQTTFIFADAIITEAALSFLGAGVRPPQPSWGNILYDGKAVIMKAPLMVIAASAALVATVFALNLLGDGLRDLVDPRSSRMARRPGMLTRLVGVRRPPREELSQNT